MPLTESISNQWQYSQRSHTSQGENVFGGPETVRFGDANGKPYEAEEKVKHDDKNREAEDN